MRNRSALMLQSINQSINQSIIGRFFSVIFLTLVVTFVLSVTACGIPFNENLSEWMSDTIQEYRDRPPKGKFFISASGSDEQGKGTRAKPFASLSAALDKMNDETLDYTVYIAGELSGSFTIKSDLKARSVTIVGEGIGLSKISSAPSMRAFTVEKDVTLQDLAVVHTSGGDAILLEEGSLTLNNVDVKGNVSSPVSGSAGIAFSTAENLCLKIEGNSSISGFAYGVYMQGAGANSKFIMEEGSIYKNSYGVFVEKEFAMKGGSIFNNKDASGAAVKVNSGGTFTMSAGIIGDHDANLTNYIPTSTSYSNANGVRVEGGSFTMTGGRISYNLGYAVNCSSGTFTMTGGVIEWNEKGVNCTEPKLGGSARIGYCDEYGFLNSDTDYVELGDSGCITIVSALEYDYVCRIDGGGSDEVIKIDSSYTTGELSSVVSKFKHKSLCVANETDAKIQIVGSDGKIKTLLEAKQEWLSGDIRKITITSVDNDYRKENHLIALSGLYYVGNGNSTDNPSQWDLSDSSLTFPVSALVYPLPNASTNDSTKLLITEAVSVNIRVRESGTQKNLYSCSLAGKES